MAGRTRSHSRVLLTPPADISGLTVHHSDVTGQWHVYRGATVASGGFANIDRALTCRDNMARSEARKPRPCLRCRRSFPSTGPGNRMCSDCRTLSEGLI